MTLPALFILTLLLFRDETVPSRLRRAILQRDLLMVKSITAKYPRLLQNPNYGDKSNTSLHLAAAMGDIDIVVSTLPRSHFPDAHLLRRNTSSPSATTPAPPTSYPPAMTAPRESASTSTSPRPSTSPRHTPTPKSSITSPITSRRPSTDATKRAQHR